MAATAQSTSMTSATEHDATPLGPVVAAQLSSLDDTDAYASAWNDALALAAASGSPWASWGGRGQGGRGLARRTRQPLDVSVEGVRLEYAGDSSIVSVKGGGGGAGSKTLLADAHLKLLAGRVYAVVGRNGCGKSSLLRRIDAGKIPGFPSHLTTLCVPQEVFGSELTPMDIVLGHHRRLAERSTAAARAEIELLEGQLEALDVETEEDQIENLCEKIARLDEDANRENDEDDAEVRRRAEDVLRYLGIPDAFFDTATTRLSGGLKKKVALSCALFYRPQLLLLDEPGNQIDISGLVQLRCLIADCIEDKRTTVVIVSHDVDLVNDVATDVIHFHDQKLSYYPGNYRDFLGYREQGLTHALRQADKLDRQRAAMLTTIDNLKKQSAGSKSVIEKKKIRRQIESRKKKLERHGVEKNEKGHRWTAQKTGGIRAGSINSIDASARSKQSHKQLLRRAETNVAPVPDKAVQFNFGAVKCTWGEPLVMAMDVGHGYGADDERGYEIGTDEGRNTYFKRTGMLFDCVDLCINEGSTTCILGANGSGKTTLLRILAGIEQPREGSVHRAHGLTVGYFSQHIADELIEQYSQGSDASGKGHQLATPLSILTDLFPTKTQQDLRGELTSFGLDPKQAATNVRFLSGGERCRLCLASITLRDPEVLLLDEVTNHLDVESVEALAYGIRHWSGTTVLVTHDANLIRSVEGMCYVLTEDDGKLRRVPGGIDSYLKAFRL